MLALSATKKAVAQETTNEVPHLAMMDPQNLDGIAVSLGISELARSTFMEK